MTIEDYNKYYVQGSDHYLIPRDELKLLLRENQKLKEKYLNAVADYETTMSEKNKLKKQLENCYCERTDCSGRIKDSKVYDSLVQKVETQQQEFIKWLEKKQSFLRDEISELTLGMCNTDFQDIKIEIYQEVLQKYKEIIGEKENENND